MTAGRNINSQKSNWCTPKKYIDLLDSFFHHNIQLDPCSDVQDIVNSKHKYQYPSKNGLKESWDFKSIYVNPPYGKSKHDSTTIKDWIKKAYETNVEYNSEIIMLIPVATNTKHWKQYIFGKAHICFLYDTRLKFRIDNSEDNKGCPMSCALIYYGNRIDDFINTFSESGYIVENTV